MNPDGTVNIEILGMRRPLGSDLFHFLHTVSWPWLILTIVGVYLAVNTLFACLYLADPGGVANLDVQGLGAFPQAFFFSIQTFSTIGYGQMSPLSTFSNAVMTAEALTGMLLNAMVTGILFSKFSRPTAKVLFSRVAIVGRDGGAPALMLRMANRRRNQIVEARVNVTLARDERDDHGRHFRRFYPVELKRSSTSIFALSWTIFHPIDEESPLFGVDAEALVASQTSLVVTLMGIDDTLSQSVHARYVYEAGDIVWGARFRDIFSLGGPSGRRMDYRYFHDYEAEGGTQ